MTDRGLKPPVGRTLTAMRYYRCYIVTVIALTLFVLYVIANLLPFQRYLSSPRPGALFGLNSAASADEDGEVSIAGLADSPIAADIPRSKMGLAERKRRREMARKWAQRHRWDYDNIKEEKAAQGRRKSGGPLGSALVRSSGGQGRIVEIDGKYKYTGEDLTKKKLDFDDILEKERANVTKQIKGYDASPSGEQLDHPARERAF